MHKVEVIMAAEFAHGQLRGRVFGSTSDEIH